MIYHIYPGTAGGQGLYIDEIYRTLKRAGYEQRAFVSFYYPFDYADRIYSKRSALGHCNYNNNIRRLLMLFETLYAHLKVLRYAVKDKPQIVNYSHTGLSYFFIIWFLKLLKKVSGCRLIVTCHDVHKVTNSERENKNRKLIFEIADVLLVHTEQSIIDLTSIWEVNIEKVVRHSFPIMDMSRLGYKPYGKYTTSNFLFIGNLSKQKGIELLLGCWPEFHRINPSATLRVCGQKLPGVVFDQHALEMLNVEFNLKFIDDQDYVEYINAAQFVLMPYEKGTNSGIVSTVLSVGATVISSDIPMFKENPILNPNRMFKSGVAKDLIRVMDESLMSIPDNTADLLSDYRKVFNKEVLNVYYELCN